MNKEELLIKHLEEVHRLFMFGDEECERLPIPHYHEGQDLEKVHSGDHDVVEDFTHNLDDLTLERSEA